MIAPKIDTRNPALSFGPYHPATRPRYPPMRAPAMPSRIVTMNPPGSRPGMSSFAMTPTISPKTIQPSTPTIRHLRGRGRANWAPSSVRRVGDNVEVFQRTASVKDDDDFMAFDRAIPDKPLDSG